MSSLVRRIQKNITKAQGFYRGPSRNEEIRKATGKMDNNEFIYNSDDQPVGYHWPKVAAPTRKEQAQRVFGRPGGIPNYDLYRLVPVSVSEETVVTTKKVIV